MDIEYFKYNILPLKDKLFRKALSITESMVEAQDVVQEVMIRLWNKKDQWPSIANIEVYSMVIAKNIALDKMRRARHYPDSIDVGKAGRELSDSSFHPHEEMEKKEKIALVWKVIRLLPERQQTLIKLREIEEFSYQEIANELNMTEAQVKVYLFRARQKMKEIYLKINGNNE